MPSPRSVRRAVHAALGLATALVVAGALVVAPGWSNGAGAPEPAAAADLSKFRPGNIISDANFFNAAAMTQTQVQSFLDSRNRSCASGTICINNYRVTSTNRPADAMCKAYRGGSNETAAAIIKKVADACGISPRVLIVTLEKEQSLISRGAAASSARWKIAMGYACPDTAACDSKYFGFFNQVYMAAWQFKRYGNPPGTSNFFTWFPVGGTANVQFHPDASCGSSRVRIENKATAALYYYTPYQPNQAALNAGYGTGNSCSAYGNRNFYQLYTDWFGSTQGGGSGGGGQAPAPAHLIQGTGQDEVWLVHGTTKFHVDSKATYDAYRSKAGNAVRVSPSVVSSYTTSSKKATLVLRNGTGSDVLLVDGGKVHRFPSCDLAAKFGTTCAGAANAPKSFVDAFAKGADVTPFVTRGSGGAVYWFGGSVGHRMFNADAVRAFNGGSAPNIVSMRPAAFDRLPMGREFLAPNSLVRSASDSKTFFVNGIGSRITANASVAAEYGASRTPTVVPDSILRSYPAESGRLTIFARCANQLNVANSGKITAVSRASAGGFDAKRLHAYNCGALSRDGSALGTHEVFLRDASTKRLYVPQAGQLRWVRGGEMKRLLNRGTTPRTLTITASGRAATKTGPTAIVPGVTYRQDGDSRTYLVTGPTSRVWVSSPGLRRDLGADQKHIQVAPGTLGVARRVTPDLTPFVSCGGNPHLINGGRLTRVSNAAGFTTTNLNALPCSVMPKGQTVSGNIFVTAPGDDRVYLLQNGTKRWVDSRAKLERLNGGRWPSVVTLDSNTLSSLRTGARY